MKNETTRASAFTVSSLTVSGKQAWPQRKAVCLAVMTSLSLLASQAYANCTTASNATTCDTNAPSPYTSSIGTGNSTASGASVTLQPNAQIVVGNVSDISFGNNATIL